VSHRAGGGLWVTGVGLVTPLGWGVETNWERLVRGDRAIDPVRLFDAAGQRASLVGEVDGVDLPPGPPELVAGWSRTSVLALSAADEAMRMARLSAGTSRIGLVVGGTTGGMFETERLLARVHGDPSLRGVMLEMLSHPLTATGERLDERLGPFVRVRTLASACSSGANALVVAAGWLLSGEVDAVLAGGSDGLCRLTLSGFNALAALDPEPCRPFDARRRGTNLGEGAGFLVLERARTALSRGATPVAELAGWAVGSEASHITNPAQDGAVVALLVGTALERAGLTPSDVDYVNAHGTATLANDTMEAAALRRALGDEVRRVPVSSSKGQIGHTLGAAGAIEAVVTALAVARRTLVPTVGLEEPDPALGLVHVPHVGRAVAQLRAALSNSFGFGGMDTVLVFAPVLPPAEALPPGRASGELSVARASESRVVITGASVLGSCGLHASAGCALLPERSHRSPSAVVDPDPYLDEARARRLDHVARLGAVVVEHALDDAAAPRASTGVLLGRAFGSADGCAAFLHRVLERGPRAASPAEFPNLVPSAPVGHVSIYGGLHGPTFAPADLAAAGECAVVQACQLVVAGEAACVVAGAAEPRGDVVERALLGLFDEGGPRVGTPRSDLGAAVVIESELAAAARAARILARVEAFLEWRLAADALVLRAPSVPGAAEVVLARRSEVGDALLARTAWGQCPRVVCAATLGESDALGAAAVAVAAARVGSGRVREALVLGTAPGRGYAILLVAA
jgi:3-oxoacyl-[acyl-carrier-protein] synthase II